MVAVVIVVKVVWYTSKSLMHCCARSDIGWRNDKDLIESGWSSDCGSSDFLGRGGSGRRIYGGCSLDNDRSDVGCSSDCGKSGTGCG